MSPYENADHVYTNESDGMTFYGYDDDDTGTTSWYDEDGNLDCDTYGSWDDDDEW